MSRGRIIKLKPGKATKQTERDWLKSITCIKQGDTMHYNPRHYRFKIDDDGWLVVRRKPSKTK